jgi:hypothetical protein
MAGAPTAPLGAGSSHELGSAFEAESRHLLADFSAPAFGALDFGLAVENDLLEIFLAFFTMIFKNWHIPLLFLIISAAGREGKGEKKEQSRGL